MQEKYWEFKPMTTHQTPPLTLWYRKPAQKWVEALPIGNGRLGAMVFGGVENERLQLNEDTLWSGGFMTTSPNQSRFASRAPGNPEWQLSRRTNSPNSCRVPSPNPISRWGSASASLPTLKLSATIIASLISTPLSPPLTLQSGRCQFSSLCQRAHQVIVLRLSADAGE